LLLVNEPLRPSRISCEALIFLDALRKQRLIERSMEPELQEAVQEKIRYE